MEVVIVEMAFSSALITPAASHALLPVRIALLLLLAHPVHLLLCWMALSASVQIQHPSLVHVRALNPQ